MQKENLTIIFIFLPDRSSKSMVVTMKQLISSLPNKAVKTITVDRGKDFSCYCNIESQFDVNIYFAESYSAL